MCCLLVPVEKAAHPTWLVSSVDIPSIHLYHRDCQRQYDCCFFCFQSLKLADLDCSEKTDNISSSTSV